MSGVVENEKRNKFKDHIKAMECTVKNLEDNFKESNHADSQVMIALQSDKIKYQGISNQLEEALKENKQLLNIFHQSREEDIRRTNSQGDVTRSCSTMSIVHLQYKYEELLANHSSLLKLMDLKSEEIKKVHEENANLKTELEQSKLDLSERNEKVAKLRAKIAKLKERKQKKISKLKIHKETLQMAHNQLVNVLHSQCMEKDNLILDEIRNCADSERALLLQEIRKNNMLAYENFQLSQKLHLLSSPLNNKKEEQI